MNDMDQQWSVWQIVLTSLVGILVVSGVVRRKSRKRLPPGPTPWPVLGNLPHLGHLPHQNLAKLAETYGPIIHIRLGSDSLVVVSSPNLAEEFLKNHDLIWASRRLTTAGRIIFYGGLDIAFADYGPRWRYARKVFMLELLTAKRLQDFQITRKQEIMSSINNLIDECDGGKKAAPIDVILRKLGLNIITRMLMNKGILNHDANAIKNTADFQESIKEAFQIFGDFYIGDYVPWLEGYLQRDLKNRMYVVAQQLDQFLQSVLDDHRQKLKVKLENGNTDDIQQDIVDALLTRPRDSDGEHLSETEMKAIILDVILAGTDTTSSTTEWGLSELLKNPKILNRAREEMDSVVGRERLVEECDLPHLPYLHAVVKETFRLHPVAALLLPHVSSEDCEIQGYKFPAKSRLFVNIYAIQRDPQIWDRPLEFYPERFLDSKKDVHGLDFDLLPFGTGRRMCPGKGLGLLQVFYTLAVAVQTCDWSLPGERKLEDLDMEECFGLTVTRLNPLQAIAIPRLPLNIIRDCES